MIPDWANISTTFTTSFPTTESILEVMEKFNRLPKPECTDLLFMRKTWEKYEPYIDKLEELQASLAGMPVYIFDSRLEMLGKAVDLSNAGRYPKMVEDQPCTV